MIRRHTKNGEEHEKTSSMKLRAITSHSDHLDRSFRIDKDNLPARNNQALYEPSDRKIDDEEEKSMRSSDRRSRTSRTSRKNSRESRRKRRSRRSRRSRRRGPVTEHESRLSAPG